MARRKTRIAAQSQKQESQQDGPGGQDHIRVVFVECNHYIIMEVPTQPSEKETEAEASSQSHQSGFTEEGEAKNVEEEAP